LEEARCRELEDTHVFPDLLLHTESFHEEQSDVVDAHFEIESRLVRGRGP
jgi:hypothetical protein